MQRPAAVILIIIDGLADISATPLQQAYTPTLDKAARYGRAGLIDPVSPGLACGSDTAHLAIFGYDPTKCYRGRGAFESMGAGMDVQPGDVAFKCNFAWMDDETGIVASRCAEKSEAMSHVAEVLVETLTAVRLEAFPGVEIDLVHAGEHRCGVVIRDRDAVLSDMVTNTDPLLDNKPLQKCEPKDVKNPAATRTADVVNEFTHVVRRILRKHPKNIIASVKKRPVSNVLLLRGASERIHVPTFEEMHGVKSFLIAPTKIIAGIGMTVGIDIIKARGATGTYNTDLISKAHACVESLMLHDNGEAAYKYALGIIHVKAVDEAAHEQDRRKKIMWLERIDAMTAEVLRLLRKSGRRDVVLVVTGDHTTPAVYGDHTCEPVPIVFCDVFDPDLNIVEQHSTYIHSDNTKKFDEIEAGIAGSLGRFPALEIMTLVKGLLHGPND